MRIYVAMTPEEWERLLALSRRERRRPQDQAAVLLSRVLRPSTPDAESVLVVRHEEARHVAA